MKKLITILTLVSMLMTVVAVFPMASMAAPATFGTVDEEYTPAEGSIAISTVAEFEAMGQGDKQSASYYLTQDLDFSGKTYGGSIVRGDFKGTLDGCGYALKGITINAGGDAGIFGTWFNGTVKNLTVGTEETPVSVTSNNGGSSVAVMCGPASSCSFDNVKIYANVDGQGKTAGFVAYMQASTVTINNCAIYGNIVGGTTAGFVVTNSDQDLTATINITNSVNYASVSSHGNNPVGGFYTRSTEGSSRTTHLTIKNSANYGAISGNDWRVGGFVGEYSNKAESTLIIDHCYNVGTITMKNGGGIAGGLVGGIAKDNAPGAVRSITNCYNAGTVVHQNSATNLYDIGSFDNFNAEGNENIVIKNVIGTLERKTSIASYEQNVATSSDPAEILAFLEACEADGAEVTFVADTDNINNGYPVLSWQVVAEEEPELPPVTEAPETTAAPVVTEAPETTVAPVETEAPVVTEAPETTVAPVETEAPETTETPDAPVAPETAGFSAGTITGENGKYTISSEDFSAFISSKANIVGGKSDLRIVLVANYDVLCDNDDAVLTVEIGGKTITMSVVDELKVYQSAVAAGEVYTAAEDCVLFGLVITGIPNDAWEDVKVTLTSANTNVSGELAKEAVVLHQTGTKLDVTNYNFEDHHGGVLEGRAAWILKIADASIRDAITNGTYTVKAAINGELYTVKDFYSTNGYVRMGLESAGVTGIRKGDVYTAEAHIYDADGNYLYYTGVYTITSGVWSSDLGQNITLPEGLVNVSDKVKVDDMTSDFKKQWGDGANKNLFDGKDGTNGTTKIGGDVNGKTLTITFELTEAVTITHYTFVTGSDTNGNATRNPVAWVLYGKDANGEWVELSNLNRDDEALGMLALNSKPFSYAVENPMACTDYKLVITARDNNGKFQMNELHLYTPAE